MICQIVEVLEKTMKVSVDTGLVEVLITMPIPKRKRVSEGDLWELTIGSKLDLVPAGGE